jgi:hypothetical protein
MPDVMKVPAVSVSATARCVECERPLLPGERFWASFVESD